MPHLKIRPHGHRDRQNMTIDLINHIIMPMNNDFVMISLSDGKCATLIRLNVKWMAMLQVYSC